MTAFPFSNRVGVLTMEVEAVILGLRALLHVAAFLIVASFYDPSARYRPGVSLFAVTLAGSNLALAMQILTSWALLLQTGAQVWSTLYAAVVLIAVAYTRGNVAKLLPRVKWGHRA